jgi:hypothetical protein
MSIFTRKGKDVKQEEFDIKEVKKFLKSGDEIKVRILSAEDYGVYKSHGGYYIFNTYKVAANMPCLKHTGQPDLYDDAVPLLYQDAEAAEKAGDTEKAEELKMIANDLRAKERYLFGFVDLSTGNQIVVDVTKGQGEGLVDDILKYEKKLGKLPFVLSKTGTKTSTKVSLSPVLDPEEDLEPTELKNFQASAGQEFDSSLFEKIFFVKPKEQQAEDLVKLGFDLSRIGYAGATPSPASADVEEAPAPAPTADVKNDLPF